MQTGPWAIAAALEDEVSEIRSRLLHPKKLVARRPLRSLSMGWLGQEPVVIAVMGEGAPAVESGLHALLEETRPSRVLVVGLAGALSPSLRTGTVVGALEVCRAGEAPLFPDAAVRDWLERAALRPVRVVSVPRLVGTPAEKAALNRVHGQERPAVVDLESYAAARTLNRAGIPWALLRAVSDAHDEALPECLLCSQREDGSVQRGKVALRALLAPRSLGTLLTLKGRVRSCSAALARAIDALSRTDAPGRSLAGLHGAEGVTR